MFGRDGQQNDQNRTVFTTAINGFATTASAGAALIGAPLMYQYTAAYVIAIAQKSYPQEFVDLTALAYWVLCYPFVFFAARASLGVALMVAGSWIALRLL